MKTESLNRALEARSLFETVNDALKAGKPWLAAEPLRNFKKMLESTRPPQTEEQETGKGITEPYVKYVMIEDFELDLENNIEQISMLTDILRLYPEQKELEENTIRGASITLHDIEWNLRNIRDGLYGGNGALFKRAHKEGAGTAEGESQEKETPQA